MCHCNRTYTISPVTIVEFNKIVAPVFLPSIFNMCTNRNPGWMQSIRPRNTAKFSASPQMESLKRIIKNRITEKGKKYKLEECKFAVVIFPTELCTIEHGISEFATIGRNKCRLGDVRLPFHPVLGKQLSADMYAIERLVLCARGTWDLKVS